MTGKRISQAAMVLLYGISGGLLVLSAAMDRWVFALLGAPFVFVTVSAVHEFGHALGCAIRKSTVNCICTTLFRVEKGRFFLHDRPYFGGYCAFLKGKNDGLVYLCGPLASLVCFLGCLVWWLGDRSDPAAAVSAVVTLLHVLKNSLPFGDHDLGLAIKEMKKGDPSL